MTCLRAFSRAWRQLPISIPESSGFFVSGWSPRETLGKANKIYFFWLAVSCNGLLFCARNLGTLLFHCPRVSPGDRTLTKKPEDSEIEIDQLHAFVTLFAPGEWPAALKWKSLYRKQTKLPRPLPKITKKVPCVAEARVTQGARCW